MQTMTLRHWAVLLLTATLLGGSFAQINIAVQTLHPLSVAAARAALAAPLAWGFLRFSGARLPAVGGAWFPLAVVGLLGAAIPFAAIAWGQERITSGLGGILFGTIPVLSVLLAPMLTGDERFTVARLGGAVIGLAGVAVVVGAGAFSGDTNLPGVAVTLLAALSYALSALYARRQRHLSPLILATGQLLVAAALLIPLGLFTLPAVPGFPGPAQIAAVLGVATLSTAIPVVLLFWLVRETGASNASLVALFIPMVAVALGALLLGEALSWEHLLGLVLIFAAAIMVSRKPPEPIGMPQRKGSELDIQSST